MVKFSCIQMGGRVGFQKILRPLREALFFPRSHAPNGEGNNREEAKEARTIRVFALR